MPYLGLEALQGSSLLYDNDADWGKKPTAASTPPLNAAAKCQMQNVSNGDGFFFFARSIQRTVLEGENALFAQEQYKVLLGAKAALINYAVFWCKWCKEKWKAVALWGMEELVLPWLAGWGFGVGGWGGVVFTYWAAFRVIRVCLSRGCTLRLTCRPMGPGRPGNPLGPSSPFWPNIPCCPLGPDSPSLPCGRSKFTQCKHLYSDSH